jgi:hypothetical protein
MLQVFYPTANPREAKFCLPAIGSVINLWTSDGSSALPTNRDLR